MEEKDVENGLNGIIDFIQLVWNELLIPLIQAMGALFDMLPPVALGIIVGIIGIFYLVRKARRG